MNAPLLALLGAAALLASAPRAWAAPLPGTDPAETVLTRPPALTRAASARMVDALDDPYVPAVPMGPSRALHTSLVMPPVPWLLTEGEAGTPRRGRVALNVSRLSDERFYTDALNNRFTFDGEEQIATLEVVSPRRYVRLGGRTLAFHVAGSLTAYSMHSDLFDGLRNFVEEELLGAGEDFMAHRQSRGRTLTRTAAGSTSDLLEPEPMWKARGVLKLPLADRRLGSHRLSSALSLGVTAPAFGSHADSGNRSVEVDATLAFALPLSSHLRLTGAANLALPGASTALERFGIPHQSLVGHAVVTLEYWPTPRFAIALGFAVNGPYTRDTSAPTDVSSYYLNIGLLYRLSACSEIHLLFAENPGGRVYSNGAGPQDSYTIADQSDADFSLTLGGSLGL